VRRALLVVAVLLAAPPTPAAAESDPCAAANPFPPAFGVVVEATWPGHRITAAVLDVRTGCAYGFRPSERVTTASVLKVELYAGILLRAQSQGRWLTSSEAAGAWPMITESANPPASTFFSSLGGARGVDALSRTFGMSETGGANPWGLTVTSAADQVHLLDQVVVGRSGPLSAPYRQALVDAMRNVVPSQRWGIGAGLPPGWTVTLKNGFADSRCCGWRTNSVGYVQPPDGGPGYVVAVLTDGWSSQAEGVAVVEWIARAVSMRLAPTPYLGFPSAASFAEHVLADVHGAPPSFADLVPIVGFLGHSDAGAAAVLDALFAGDRSGRGDLVALLYRGLLGRPVDLDAMAWWRGVVRRHGSAAVAAALLDTPELRAATAGLDDGQFVAWVYDRLLGRPPDAGGAAAWVAEIARAGRAVVVTGVAGSAEARARLGAEAVVVQVYDALLHRLPSPSEVDARAGVPRGDLAVAVVGSSEYRG
jgi:beta-lactamase class A